MRRVVMLAGIFVVIVSLGAQPAVALKLEKTVDPTNVPEAGGEVTYTLTFSECADLVIGCFVTDITDDTHGPITVADCALPVFLAAADEVSCSFTRDIKRDDPKSIQNTTTATGFEGATRKRFSASDTAEVTHAGGGGPSTEQDVGRVPTQNDIRRRVRLRIDSGSFESGTGGTGGIDGNDIRRRVARSIRSSDVG